MATTRGIKLDQRTVQRLKDLAHKRDRSPHWIMRTAIETYLTREEQYEREKAEDMARWEEYKLTGKAIGHEEAKRWLQKLADGKYEPWHE